jgi:hypothetical protein
MMSWKQFLSYMLPRVALAILLVYLLFRFVGG